MVRSVFVTCTSLGEPEGKDNLLMVPSAEYGMPRESTDVLRRPRVLIIGYIASPFDTSVPQMDIPAALGRC